MLTELEERGQVSSKRSWAVGDKRHMKKSGGRRVMLRGYLDFFFDLN